METPKKKVPKKRGRKATNLTTINDFCRICSCSFKNVYGDFAKTTTISTENIFNLPGRSGVGNLPLAFQFKSLGYSVEQGDGLSSRVCAKCATKVRRASELKLFLDCKCLKKEELVSPERFKRMSSSPSYVDARKTVRINSPGTSSSDTSIKEIHTPTTARKRINFTSSKQDERPSESVNNDLHRQSPTCESESRDDIAHLLHLNKIDFTVSKPRVKVIIPRGESMSIRTPPDDTIAALIKNLCTKKWKSAANCLLNYPQLKQEILPLLTRTISKEMSSYCKGESILKNSSSDDIASLENSKIVEEAKAITPVWYSCISGACNAHKSEKKLSRAINPLALITAVVAKHNNHCMSAAAKRISAILLHSGAKSQDFSRLNHLGVSTSHKQAIRDQCEMGKNYDAKVLGWKKEVEKQKRSLKLIAEIERNESTNGSDLDTSQTTLHKYKELEEVNVEVNVKNLEEIKSKKQQTYR